MDLENACDTNYWHVMWQMLRVNEIGKNLLKTAQSFHVDSIACVTIGMYVSGGVWLMLVRDRIVWCLHVYLMYIWMVYIDNFLRLSPVLYCSHHSFCVPYLVFTSSIHCHLRRYRCLKESTSSNGSPLSLTSIRPTFSYLFLITLFLLTFTLNFLLSIPYQTHSPVYAISSVSATIVLLLLYQLQITAGLSLTSHHSHAAVLAYSQAT